MFRKLLLVLVMSLFAASMLAANLDLKILNPKRKPFSGSVTCKLVNLETKQELPTNTNTRGELTFEDLAAGNYILYVAPAGYVPAQSKVTAIGTRDVELTVQLADEKQFQQFDKAGAAAFEQQNYAAANEQYAKAYQLAPWHSDLCANYVRTLLRAGEGKKAAEIVKTLGENNSNWQNLANASLRFEEGLMALEEQDFKKAETLLTEAVQGDPANADAYYGLALALGHQQRYVEALKPINLAVTLRPNDEQFQKVRKSIEYNARMTGK